jgi:aminopeptidase N
MKHLCRASVLLMFIPAMIMAQSTQPGAPGLGDSLYPNFGNGGYDVQHYTLDLSITPASGNIDGITTIDARATQDLSSFNLDLIGLQVESTIVNGAGATFTRNGQELTITPDHPIANQSLFSVMVGYSGIPEAMESVAIALPTGWIRYGRTTPCPCSFVVSEPDGAANFYPVNDHPLDKATYSLRVTVPKPYEVAANGVLMGISDNGDTTTTHTEVTAPMASYLTTINISQFDKATEAGTHGVPIRNYFEVGLNPAYAALFAQQDEMIGYFESLFGSYPFDVYGALVLNNDFNSALEDQTLSVFGKNTLDPSGDNLAIPHELAHQWFGDSVSLSDWSDIWLNEGFATYAEGLWIEHESGRQALDAWARDLYQQLDPERSLPPPMTPPADDLFNISVYLRGGLTLHALRLHVGDSAFFQILQQWYTQHRDGSVTTAELIALANHISGEDLSGLFHDWLYAQPLPPFPT